VARLLSSSSAPSFPHQRSFSPPPIGCIGDPLRAGQELDIKLLGVVRMSAGLPDGSLFSWTPHSCSSGTATLDL